MTEKDIEIITDAKVIYRACMDSATEAWGISEEDLWASSRTRHLTDMRIALTYLTYRYTFGSHHQVLPSHIWRAIGEKKDRSTIYHMIRVAPNLLRDTSFRDIYTKLKNISDENVYRN